MRHAIAFGLVLFLSANAGAAEAPPPLPRVAEGWKAEIVVQAPQILFPSAIVAAEDGSVYLGQDPMDMPGPPTQPIDSIVRIRDGKVSVFAEGLWAVMGLEWINGTLYVVHAPYLSALKDTDGDGRADSRVDLMTGLGPKLPGFSGINDHVPSGIRLGMDGFLYIAVGDKGIPRGVGKDGTTIQLYGGGVIRIRPDGSGLEVVSTGERNPLSVALSASDDVFTYGNDDDSKKWPNSLTHHIVGGHYGYPYQFLDAPDRALPIVAGQLGGSGTQGICYNEDGLPESYRGDLFFCDWGLQTVFRYKLERAGGTFKVKEKTPFVTAGDVKDFRPFSLAVARDGRGLWLVDWAYMGWLADGPKTGRLYRLTYEGADRPTPSPRPSGKGLADHVRALDHPALSVRLVAQRRISEQGTSAVEALAGRLSGDGPTVGRVHALWAFDAIGGPEARGAIRRALGDREADLRLQAARSSGIRRDREAEGELLKALRDGDAAVRREAAIALGRMADPKLIPPLMAALGDPDPFVSWSIRQAIRKTEHWDEDALVEALLDPRRRDDALKLVDEAWAVPVVHALGKAITKAEEAPIRSRMVSTLAGLYRRYPEWSGNWFGTNPLGGQYPEKSVDWDAEGMRGVVKGLARSAEDPDPGVRLSAIEGLRPVGAPALTILRRRLSEETDPRILAAIAATLGALGDADSAPLLASLLSDPARPEGVRIASLDALASLPGPKALTARLGVIYDAKAPASLIARALPPLGRSGVLPPNDLAGFCEHADPKVRAAALLGLTPGRDRSVPEEVKGAVLARLDDADPEVRRAGMESVARLKIREAIPGLLRASAEEADRAEATRALAAIPDPRAYPLFLAAIQERDPVLRREGEAALLAIRDLVAGKLEEEARSGRLNGPGALAVERILTRFTPLTDWRVIGPFARTTAKVFLGESEIDFSRTHSGVEGRPISWTPRKGDPETGRVVLSDFKEGVGDRGGFGYDTNGSPDLAAFGYTEVTSDRDRPALLLVGSSGTLIVTVNEQEVMRYVNFAGRPYAPDSNLIRIELKKGTNRILVMSRQGIGEWSFGVRLSDPAESLFATRPGTVGLDQLRAFALANPGDPKKGEEIFFDLKGIGCVKCHSAGGRGSASVGPDLTGLALKYDRAEIVRSVLEPSNRLATGYQPVLAALADGRVVTGLVRAETDSHLDLVDADARVTRVEKAEIDERRVGDVSLMPTGLVDTLSPPEFADLIAYLQGLKEAPPAPASGR